MRIPPLALLLLLSACVGNAASQPRHQIDEGVPHTRKPFLDDPDDFQFVIVGDRTGGHRPGVFDRAMDQVNLLQPEFVMCVGDLIEGYSEDPAVLAAEWEEFDGMLDKLEMPFFYTVGNHDMGNNVMREMWLARHGRDYYSFVYKDVLFLSLNTEDPPIALSPDIIARSKQLEEMMLRDPEGTMKMIADRSRAEGRPKLPGEVNISDEQIAFVRSALEEHPDVRWTLLFMHKPAWEYGGNSFERIEALLGARPYTVFAGHEHYYSYTSRNGRDYIDLGTTGGIWLTVGPGALDHVAWVTMTDAGPIVANIRLDGLLDKHGPR